jgi:hypothetical protein
MSEYEWIEPTDICEKCESSRLTNSQYFASLRMVFREYVHNYLPVSGYACGWAFPEWMTRPKTRMGRAILNYIHQYKNWRQIT